LWPANHKLVSVAVDYAATDVCGRALTGVLTVASSDPVTGPDDDTSPDWVVVDAHHVQLRAERLGSNAGGRVYTITITATDGAGNATTATAIVTVPHNGR